jgi:hypothetical protein
MSSPFIKNLGSNFTITYRYERRTSGFPPEMDPARLHGVKELAKSKVKDAESLVQYIELLHKGCKEITVSSNGKKVLYICRSAGKVYGVAIIGPKSTEYYIGSTNQGSVRPGFDLSHVPFAIPPILAQFEPMPAYFESADTITGRSADTSVVPLNMIQVQSVQKSGKAVRNPGSFLPSQRRFVLGSIASPALDITYKGSHMFRGIELSTDIASTNRFNIAMAESKDVKVSDSYHYQLVSAKEGSVDEKMFNLDTYLKDLALIDDGRALVGYRKGDKTYQEQLKAAVSKPNQEKGSVGSTGLLLVIFAGVAVVGAGVSLLKRKLAK